MESKIIWRIVLIVAVVWRENLKINNPDQISPGQVIIIPIRVVDKKPIAPEEVVPIDKYLGTGTPIDRIGTQQTAEEQDLGDQEKPHPQLRCVELLSQRLEVMGQMRRMFIAGSRVVFWVVRFRHDTFSPGPTSPSGVSKRTVSPSTTARIIPWLSSPRSFAGSRFATTTTVFPTRSSLA